MVAAACINGLANVRALLVHDGIKTSLKNNVCKRVLGELVVLFWTNPSCVLHFSLSSGKLPWTWPRIVRSNT